MPANPTVATARPSPFFSTDQSLQAGLPGLVMRGYLGGNFPPLTYPTPCVAIIKDSKEFYDTILPLITNEMRGTMDVGRIEYAAYGYIVLEKDTQVSFDIGNMVCKINNKDFGKGKYTQKMQKGRYPIELTRAGWNDGAPQFNVTDSATSQSVLFHTGDTLKREMVKPVRLDSKVLPNKVVGPVTQ